MKIKSNHERNVEFVMASAKCDSKLARRALRATKGQHWIHAAIYARDEIATLSVPTGPAITCEDLAKARS